MVKLPRHCATCARGFHPTADGHLYCSPACKLVGRYQPCCVCGNPTTTTRAKATRTTKHGACWEHGTRSGYSKHGCRCGACRAVMAERKAVHLDRKLRPRRALNCQRCGLSFTTRREAARFCSTRCSDQHSGGSRWIAPDERRAIYERDGWTCQLCGGPVETMADWWTDWYPSLDHIVPRSLTAHPDHSPGNLRTAHRWCNLARGVGEVDPVLFGKNLE